MQFELFGCPRATKPFWGEALGALAKPVVKRKIWGRNRDFDKNRKIQPWRQKHEKLRASGARWPLGPSTANFGVDFFAKGRKMGVPPFDFPHSGLDMDNYSRLDAHLIKRVIRNAFQTMSNPSEFWKRK